VHLLSLESLPLSGTYATLGIDRALAVLAAGHRYGWPVLVVDAGTALTVSAADPTGTFVGGAILPGLGLQAHALHQATAALPLIRWSDPRLILPPRWARETDQAIESGILYTVLAGVREFWQEWQAMFPHSSLLLTGGDGSILWQHFNQDPELADRLYLDPYLVLYGIAECRNAASSV
jgi:type III pantothenate kinase